MYSSSDIEKYLNGELSAPEMHALERAALDDPFLADALDGMEIHRRLPEQAPFREDIAELQQRLQKRVAAKEKNKARAFPLPMRYAAAVILLAGLGITAYYTAFNNHRSPAAVAQSHVPSASPVTDSAPSAEKALPLADTTTAQSSANTASVPQPSAIARKKDREVSVANNVASTLAKQTEQAAMDKTPSLADERAIAGKTSEQVRLDTLRLHFDTGALAKRVAGIQINSNYLKAGPEDKFVFSGQVTDEHNNPLAGAFLALKNNQHINATTDKNGFFNLRLNNKFDTSSTVLVNHVGYEQGAMSLNTDNKKGNFIQLQSQPASLNEVVIVGYGAKRKEIMRQNIDAQHKALSLVAVPAAGWPAYREYLESARTTANLDSTLRGDEAISFIVSKNGELSSFKVEQSISPAHDSATIRMIKQGPAWQLLSGKKARARVILTY
ncbi:MAG: carboxypeptidase-like regulatory domain-containing protein [Chitinophagaceae bacterium]|nr:carboxypeptidase-like regulatory domain-containing protein [Chitinophagaceae bacterium]